MQFLSKLSDAAFRKVEVRFGDQLRAGTGHRQLGLLYHDIIAETADVDEALRRLPADVRIARDRRAKVAFDLDLKGILLPQHMWVRPDEDVPYLAPYLDEVVRERTERVNWRALGKY